MKVFNSQGVQKESEGIQVQRTTVNLSSTGSIVYTPASGKTLRIYSIKFSSTEDDISVSFRFNSGGSDFEKYTFVQSGGLYGSNSYPNYIKASSSADSLYCVNTLSTGRIQINLDYTEE